MYQKGDGKLRHSSIPCCILSIYGSEINNGKTLQLLILTVDQKSKSKQNGLKRFYPEHFKTLRTFSDLLRFVGIYPVTFWFNKLCHISNPV